ncbi:sigma-54-dependent Fis family transcriptional regulator [candidate division KSB1 bacterium]|nr:sigma-54-dependent Fis family transcriptional regulator [candidate division KSB1 bacterium]
MEIEDYVLIVDDERVLRESLAEWLTEDGFHVLLADSGMEALRIIQEKKPTIAVIDIKMPGMDGISLLRKIREVDSNIVVIMITAFATVDNAVQSMKDGAFDFITKPFPPEKLSNMLHHVLEHQQLKRENIRLKEERSHILRMALTALVTFIVLALLIYFIFV